MAEKTAKNAMVSDEFAKKFATEKETPYTRWIKSEGLDLISSTYVQNLHTVELKPWARRGGHGVFLNHDASRTSNDIREIADAATVVGTDAASGTAVQATATTSARRPRRSDRRRIGCSSRA